MGGCACKTTSKQAMFGFVMVILCSGKNINKYYVLCCRSRTTINIVNDNQIVFENEFDWLNAKNN